MAISAAMPHTCAGLHLTVLNQPHMAPEAPPPTSPDGRLQLSEVTRVPAATRTPNHAERCQQVTSQTGLAFFWINFVPIVRQRTAGLNIRTPPALVGAVHPRVHQQHSYWFWCPNMLIRSTARQCLAFLHGAIPATSDVVCRSFDGTCLVTRTPTAGGSTALQYRHTDFPYVRRCFRQLFFAATAPAHFHHQTQKVWQWVSTNVFARNRLLNWLWMNFAGAPYFPAAASPKTPPSSTIKPP